MEVLKQEKLYRYLPVYSKFKYRVILFQKAKFWMKWADLHCREGRYMQVSKGFRIKGNSNYAYSNKPEPTCIALTRTMSMFPVTDSSDWFLSLLLRKLKAQPSHQKSWNNKPQGYLTLMHRITEVRLRSLNKRCCALQWTGNFHACWTSVWLNKWIVKGMYVVE